MSGGASANAVLRLSSNVGQQGLRCDEVRYLQKEEKTMNSKQYEELCRFFLADKLGISCDGIQSAEIPNPRRPGLPEYKHQIDLYWETGDEVALYLNIANAKWRSKDKVDQPEVLLLEQVRQKVGAHKAVMLTNVGFTAGAKAAAQDTGIALHIVQPNFDYKSLPQQKIVVIQTRLQQLAANTEKPIYLHNVVYKAFDLATVQSKPLASAIERPTQAKAAEYSTKVVQGHSTRIMRDISHRGSTGRGGVGSLRKQGGGGSKGSGGSRSIRKK